MRRFGLLVTVFLLFATPALAMQRQEMRQKQASFLYHFMKFVEWPVKATGDSWSDLCVMGDPAMAKILQDVLPAPKHHKPVRLRNVSSVAQAKSCHILFISGVEKARLRGVLEGLNGTPVLTVSDMEHFAQEGGMIGFVQEKERLRIEINPYSASYAKLKLDSSLLEIATAVVGP